MSREQDCAVFPTLVGSIFMHTPKAVRAEKKMAGFASMPATRVLTVCGWDDGLPKRDYEVKTRPYLVAWKCELTPDGLIQHPAYKKPLSPSDPRLFSPKHGRNGSEPTACFRPDSFYTKVWAEDLVRIARERTRA